MEEKKEVKEVTETVTDEKQVKEITYNDYRKELSKELGINMFDKDGMKQLKSILTEHNEYKESQKTTQEKAQERLTGYETREKEWATKSQEYDSKIAGLELDINPSFLNDAMTLAKSNTEDISIKDKLSKVLERYPNFKGPSDGKVKAKVEIGGQHDNKQQNKGSGDPLLDNWKKRQAKRKK